MLSSFAGRIKLKAFIRENETNETHLHPTELDGKFSIETDLSGEKVQEFYEKMLSSPPSNKGLNKEDLLVCNEPKCVSAVPVACTVFKNSDLLSMAQNNDVYSMKKFFASTADFDINIVDEFGWTALMCAACSGAEDAVKILLQKGAITSKQDRIGNTALKLAKNKRLNNIVFLLEKHDMIQTCNIEETTVPSLKTFYCDLCKQNFTMDKKKHETSILHLLNEEHKTPTFYGIPEANKGFQMLLKGGWNKERGLGRYESGRKFPIKTKQKNNRSGVGAPEPIYKKIKYKKDCHGKKINKKIQRYQKIRDKEISRNFHLEFFD